MDSPAPGHAHMEPVGKSADIDHMEIEKGDKLEMGSSSSSDKGPMAQGTPARCGVLGKWDAWTAKVDHQFKDSFLGRYFEVKERSSSLFQELRAGVVCFLTVCYIIPVNAGILSDTGGSCHPEDVCSADNFAVDGPGCRFYDPGYSACVVAFKNDLIASTCIAAFIATFLMGAWARMPLAVAPAMGVNAYFTYNVVGFYATKMVSYEGALAAAFVEGWLFILISLSGVRGKIIELIPRHIMYATAAGIGCFLAFIGLQQAEGLGAIAFDPATLVTLGGCPPDQRARAYSMRDDGADQINACLKLRDYLPAIGGKAMPVPGSPDYDKVMEQMQTCGAASTSLGPASPNYTCLGAELRSAPMWLGIIGGGGVMVLLMMKRVPAAILFGLLLVTFIAWIPGHPATYFGGSSQVGSAAAAEARYDYFLKGATTPSVERTGGKLDFGMLSKGDTWVALITFLYLDFLDATSTMFTMARLVNEEVPGFVTDKGSWPRQLETMLVDGLAIVVGSTLGTSPLTVFAESAVGIREGGRTGITAIIVAIGFGISMFLSPIFSSIPPYATGPAIILVGALMFEHARHIEWDDLQKAVPSFLTIILMPLTYSIAYGVIAGLMCVFFLWALDGLWKLVFNVIIHRKWTLKHLFMDMFSHVYVAADKEDVLIRELPGYMPPVIAHAESRTPDTVRAGIKQVMV